MVRRFFLHSLGVNKKAPHISVQCFRSGGDYRAVFDHGDRLQSMHGALPAELSPHSFGVNKKAPHISVQCFRSGGDYRDRTGDLLHAMQALSQLS